MDTVETLNRLLADGKDSGLLRFSLGNEFFKRGEMEQAVHHLREAVRQQPDYSAAYKLLGKALAESGQLGEAKQVYRRGIDTALEGGDQQAAKEMTVFLRRLEKQA